MNMQNITHTIAAYLFIRIIQRIIRRSRVPRITFGYTGEEWVQSLIHGPDARFQSAARMEKSVFFLLATKIRQTGILRERRKISVEGQIILFLRLASLTAPNRELQERFQLSAWTIGACLHAACDALARLSADLITLPPPTMQTQKIVSDPKYSPFSDALGAIDGTHIPVHVPTNQHDLFRNRKGTLSQNVLAVVDFEMNFVFVLAGWEGKAHDAAVLEDALSVRGFSVPQNRFYLGDGGYANRWPVISPFRRVRYHLKEWASGTEGYDSCFYTFLAIFSDFF
jgi:hypothetical protein